MTLSPEWTERRSGSAPERRGDTRSPHERDYSRLLHSSAFRRLQGKTQVLGIGESDFHRTRLTHSMEVAQIGRGLVQVLGGQFPECEVLPPAPLIEAISFGHDIGHPPHGHSGEIALNYVMRDFGGFEGNAQSLRLLSRKEPYSDAHGLDLTRRTLLGILKYPAPHSRVSRTEQPQLPENPRRMNRDNWEPPKCYFDEDQEIVSWILGPLGGEDRETFQSLRKEPSSTENGKTAYKSLDASIMDIADDIAYGVHDLEDAIKLDLVSEQDLMETLEENTDPQWSQQVDLSEPEDLAGRLADTGTRKKAIGELVHAFILSVRLERQEQFGSPLLDWTAALSEPAEDLLEALDELKIDKVIEKATAQQMEYRGRLLIMRLFEALSSDPKRLLKSWHWEQYRSHDKAGDKQAAHRVICDYIAGMTDEYATEVYERLFVPHNGRVSAAR
ncbi:anti-phage deoxyguanosine triphosphatase [Salinibacter altiplanensis]|uniref:anti-phage deoxyguanosine triphosphatase n=1 Tax=Salinibacter altiplanensis TaxID=1803181 RepID=UPI000C9FDA31|nr:anti-phage deoxyguanosine triphosphatase [Salinibacter altiplanensis]